MGTSSTTLFRFPGVAADEPDPECDLLLLCVPFALLALEEEEEGGGAGGGVRREDDVEDAE